MTRYLPELVLIKVEAKIWETFFPTEFSSGIINKFSIELLPLEFCCFLMTQFLSTHCVSNIGVSRDLHAGFGSSYAQLMD